MTNIIRLRDVVSFFAFGAIIVFVLGYFGWLGLRVNPPAGRTNLSMEVLDINGLVPGSNVLLRGVAVGKVFDITASLNSATVDFYIEHPYQIPVDSEVRLENLSALGESYIGLQPRSQGGEVFQEGQRIATEKVIQPPSISELANSVVRLLNQLDPGALDRIIGEGFAALPHPAEVLPNIRRASVLLRNTAVDRDGHARVLLGNFQALLRNAEWVGPVLDGLTEPVADLGKAIQDLYKHIPIIVQRGEPGNVESFNKLLGRLQAFLDARGGDLKVIGEAFEPKLVAVAGALMNFDTGQLLDNMLAAVPADGTITLRVVP